MKKALGKGLSALIPDNYAKDIAAKVAQKVAQTEEPSSAASKDSKAKVAPTPEAAQPKSSTQGFQILPMDQIFPNMSQPRKELAPEGIQELASSIKEKGILQPVVVTKAEAQGYTLICGERRFRAAKLCGLKEIPAVIKEVAPSRFFRMGFD